jgi:hypothetical protein
MDNKKYIFTYHCRMCNKTFTDAFTGKRIALSCLLQTAYNLPKDSQHPGDITLHYADDHIGIADLVGCKIEE